MLVGKKLAYDMDHFGMRTFPLYRVALCVSVVLCVSVFVARVRVLDRVPLMRRKRFAKRRVDRVGSPPKS